MNQITEIGADGKDEFQYSAISKDRAIIDSFSEDDPAHGSMLKNYKSKSGLSHNTAFRHKTFNIKIEEEKNPKKTEVEYE